MNCAIIRYAEIGVKGKNRRTFEELLKRNIRTHLKTYGIHKVELRRGRLVVWFDYDEETFLDQLCKIPGISSVSPVHFSTHEMTDIQQQCETSVQAMIDANPGKTITFRVSARRANKNFHLYSTAIERDIGGCLVQKFPQLKVDLNHFEMEVGIEIWAENSVIFVSKKQGISGMPVDPRQVVIGLISGGIDSPVSSWMLMKRGCRVVFLHFHSFPYIGEQSKEKVIDLVRHLAATQPHTRLYVVPFAEIQKTIKNDCPDSLRTLLYRRFMNRIANDLALREKGLAIITGDSLSQVASQTLDNLVCTTENAAYPVLRPLIGMDKHEIIAVARKIGTYPLSILDFPDCCTVFQPQKPATRASLRSIHRAEAMIADPDKLVKEALDGAEMYDFYPDSIKPVS
ncbi:MAG: tRNA 4-thiouridine(8) synthase ThiI [SAR324 cluster bacterium]|nr:tRNA 4-thiouridine(8) synthase ThiI [SAR324 cluster bacterium]